MGKANDAYWDFMVPTPAPPTDGGDSSVPTKVEVKDPAPKAKESGDEGTVGEEGEAVVASPKEKEKEPDWADKVAGAIGTVTQELPSAITFADTSPPNQLWDKFGEHTGLVGATPAERRAAALRTILSPGTFQAATMVPRGIYRTIELPALGAPARKWAHSENLESVWEDPSLSGVAKLATQTVVPPPNTDRLSDMPDWYEELARGITGSEAPLDEEQQSFAVDGE